MFGAFPCPSTVVGIGYGTLSGAPNIRRRDANPYGCAPVAGRVTTTGKGVGGAFVMPPDAIRQAAAPNGHWLHLESVNPALEQITTGFAFAGPAVARTGAP